MWNLEIAVRSDLAGTKKALMGKYFTTENGERKVL